MSPSTRLSFLPAALVVAGFIVIASSIVACGASPHEEPSVGGEEAANEAVPVAQQEPAPPPADVYFDLLAHRHRATQRRAGVSSINFRNPSGGQFTLGGWTTHFALDDQPSLGGQGAVMRGNRGSFPLPQDGLLSGITANLWVPSGRVLVFVGGEQIASMDDAPQDGFETRSLTFAEPIAITPQTRLEFRVQRNHTIPDSNARMALGWLELAPNGQGPDPLPGDENLHLTEDTELGYGFQVPAGARLRGRIHTGRITAELSVDGADTDRLGDLNSEEPFDLDLSTYEGKFVRLTLRAMGDVDVERANVVIPERPRVEAPPATNVVIYLIDTLRADKLEVYNPDTEVTTPGMNRFGSQATLFRRAHTQENWTKPSVATLMSSLFPWEHRATTGSSRVPQSVTLLSELLEARNFHTGAFIANGYVSDAFGFGRGWTTYRNYIRESRNTDAENVAHDALAWLDNRPEDKPFFLYIHTIDPHVPYRPPDEFLDPYFQGPYHGPVTPGGTAQFLGDLKTGRRRANARDREYIEALHNGEISYHDVHFNAIMEGLSRRGLTDDTVIVVTADHGEEFWDHGSVGHGHNVYEQLLHIPMLVKLPGQSQAMSMDAPVGLVDVMPTVLEVLNQERPPELSGTSFLPSLLGFGQRAPRTTVAGFMDNFRVVIEGDHKLIYRPGDRIELYNLASDPREENNIAEDHPLTVEYLRGLLGQALSRSAPSARTARRARPRHRRETVTIDAQTREQLRALGYVD